MFFECVSRFATKTILFCSTASSTDFNIIIKVLFKEEV